MPPDAPEAAEAGWTRLHPRMVTRWRLDGLGTAAVVTAAAAGLALLAWRAEWMDGPVLVVGPLTVFGVAVICALVWPPIAYRHWSYRLAPDALEIRRGVIVQRRSAVPYRRVQQVDLSRGPIDRVLGLTSADLTTAAATSDGSIPGLAPETAEHFRQVVLARAGRDDAV